MYIKRLTNIAKFLLFAICTTSSSAKTTSEIGKFDDWIISNSCSQNANILCGGFYKPYPFPPNGSTGAQADGSKEPIKVTSDSASFVAKGTSEFLGNVIASQGNKVIHADKAIVVHNPDSGELETITALGHVKIMQPGLRIDGTKAIANVPADRQKVDQATYRIYAKHARGQATNLEVLNNSTNMQLANSTYTTCAPTSNAWYLKASKTEFNKETGRGEAWHAKMYVKDTPVFYWPYVNFPIDKRRQTGFLQPSFEDSTLNGKTVTLPFYWNMAPNYDSTITTNYMSLRGVKFDNKFRYLTRDSHGEFNFDFVPHDRAYAALRKEWRGNAQFMQSNDPRNVLRRNDMRNSDFRYRLALKNSTVLPDNWHLNLDYTDASDGNYLYDFKTTSYNYVTDRDSSIYALQRATLQNYSRFGALKTQVERYQTFHVIDGPSGEEQLTKLPELGFGSNSVYLPLGFTGMANMQYVNFRPHAMTSNLNALSYGQRFHARPALSYPLMQPGWFVQPRVQINYVQYERLHVVPIDLANGITPKNAHMAIPMYDLKTGLIFERNAQFKQKDFLQTLEPQLYYLYVPQRNQNHLPNFDSGLMTFDYNQVFRDNRYTGSDYVSEASQLGMGVSSKFYDAYSGEEQGMLALGRIRYFRNKILLLDQELDNVDKHWSPFAFLGRIVLVPGYTLEGNLVRSRRYTDTASVQLQYKPDTYKVFNFSYQYVRNPQPDDVTGLNSNLNQISVSSAWQLISSWRLLGKVNYDLRFNRYLETLAGFEYHTCCTALRVTWGRTALIQVNNTHAHNNKFRIQFIFKGFAGVGNAEDRYIASLIPGYTPHSSNF